MKSHYEQETPFRIGTGFLGNECKALTVYFVESAFIMLLFFIAGFFFIFADVFFVLAVFFAFVVFFVLVVFFVFVIFISFFAGGVCVSCGFIASCAKDSEKAKATANNMLHRRFIKTIAPFKKCYMG